MQLLTAKAPSSTNTATLLSYLHGGDSDARPTLALVPSLPDEQNRDNPFVLLDDADPISRLVEATFVTDAGTPLKKVIMRIQKDQYPSESGTMTNVEVDAAWRSAYSPRNSSPLLSAQITPQGELARLNSLFYCGERRLFFHPVCPSCGANLDLCTDDDLLTRAGLHPYATSLRRYLHCPLCCGDGLQEFYLYERESTDPVAVKDRWSLIDRFRFVTAGHATTGGFPCVGCDQHENCYGIKQNARVRITPFAFYPYYLIMYDDLSRHAEVSDVESPLPPPVVARPVSRAASDQVILGVLTGMIEACRLELRSGRPSPALEALSREPEIDDDETATVILAPRKGAEKAPRPPEDDMVTETVILTPDMPTHGYPPRREDLAPNDALEETVIMTPQGVSRGAAPAPPLDSGDGGTLEDTVCFNPKQGGAVAERRPTTNEASAPVAPSTVSGDREDDPLGETIVIMPRPGGRRY